MPNASDDDEMTREEKTAEKVKQAAAKKDLAAAVKKFKASGEKKEDYNDLHEVIVRYHRIIEAETTKLLKKYKKFQGGRRTRRRSRRGTRRH